MPSIKYIIYYLLPTAYYYYSLILLYYCRWEGPIQDWKRQGFLLHAKQGDTRRFEPAWEERAGLALWDGKGNLGMGWVKLNKDQKSDFVILNLGCAELCCVCQFSCFQLSISGLWAGSWVLNRLDLTWLWLLTTYRMIDDN